MKVIELVVEGNGRYVPMHITQRPKAESVATTWVNIAINHCVVPGGRNFENLTNLIMDIEGYFEGR